MRGLGLRAKVTIFVSCLVVGIISMNAAFTIRAERQERERQLMEQGKLFARLTSTDVARAFGSLSMGLGGTDVKAFDLRMSRFFGYYPDLTRLMVVSDRGMVLYDSGDGAGHIRSMTRIDDKDLLERLASPGMLAVETKGPGGDKLMDIVAPVTESGGPQFIKVRYIISYRSLDKRLAEIRLEFLLLAGFFILAGVGAAMAFSARITKPILKLRSGAAEIARGNLELTVDVPGRDEIGELGQAFNTMARSLKDSRTSLEAANESLVRAHDELMELQGELVRSERMAAVGQLAAGLSHEIDNPIGVILGFAELMLDETPKGDPRREDIVTILEESKRCKRIVRGLLDFSRPVVLGVAPTDVNDVVSRTVEAATSQRRFKQVKVGLELSEHMPVVMADPDRLRQVFMNLLLNASQAMPEGGEIVVRSWVDEAMDRLCVSFRDTGAGIPIEHMDKIFEPFFSTKRPGEGTGLGLAICERLLEEQGGSITAESGPDGGATFTVTLPLYGEADPNKDA